MLTDGGDYQSFFSSGSGSNENISSIGFSNTFAISIASLSEGMELDVFIPSINVGIEYDGPYHNGEESYKRDLEKYKICKTNGIKLGCMYELN